MLDKPGIFIGSSAEGLALAEALFACLAVDTRPTLWTNQLFLPGEYPLETLEAQLRQHSFAVLVASPDDQLVKRGESAPTVRDNLLLEFGLFAGVCGRHRVFFVCPDQPQVHLPSDLAGVILAKYDGDRASRGASELSAAVQVACQQIREVVRREWASLQKAQSDNADSIRASEQGRALQRLHNIIIQLRDGMMAVQRDAFASISDESAFNTLKTLAVNKIREIVGSIRTDATEVRVEEEVNLLERATVDALRALPFPTELAVGQREVRQKVVNTGFGALGALLDGSDPFRHIEGAVSREADLRVERLRRRYVEWWEASYPPIAEATATLQDKLFIAAIKLGSRSLGTPRAI